MCPWGNRGRKDAGGEAGLAWVAHFCLEWKLFAILEDEEYPGSGWALEARVYRVSMAESRSQSDTRLGPDIKVDVMLTTSEVLVFCASEGKS